MTVEGHIENGKVVLDGPPMLPNGIKITVSVQAESGQSLGEEPLPSLYERLKSVAGKAQGLPSDLAINHDHYLHGQFKRQ